MSDQELVVGTRGSALALWQASHVAEKLKARPNVRVEISAFTDSSGDPELNKRLSLKRAEMVKEMLVAKGVASENLEAVGRGATNYLTTNATEEGRQMNRRVEFTIF